MLSNGEGVLLDERHLMSYAWTGNSQVVSQSPSVVPFVFPFHSDLLL